MPSLAPRHLVRAADADLLDTFLISAVATIVVIRIFLEATGYPQLGGGGLHIAHVLWGGLGKFVTSDNNYFFKPTAAILYALFVVLFLATREIRRFRDLSPEECLVNSVELAERLASGTLTADDRDRALQLLTRADQAHPLVAPLRAAFVAADVAPTSFVRLRWVGLAGAR